MGCEMSEEPGTGLGCQFLPQLSCPLGMASW